jgi:hypothetical protein
MASTFKSFTSDDITNSRTLLYEAVPLTGSLLSGTYGAWGTAEGNIKNYAHGIFSSIYDYPYLSSSANHLLDLSVGFSSDSALSASVPATQQTKKINMYNQMAKVLMGTDQTGSILKFDQDGNILAGGTKLRECIFINFARLLTKDEIKKGSFTMQLGAGQNFANANTPFLTITDAGAQNSYFVNSPAGEYSVLSASAGQGAGATSGLVGLIYYQAGVVVLTASVFNIQPAGQLAANAQMALIPGGLYVNTMMTGSEISSSCDAIRHRIYSIQFSNTTELNSTIYFARINHNDFSYSSNPTYLSSSKMVVKNTTSDSPVAYICGIGLVSSDNALLGVAKLSEPLRKDPSIEYTLRLRLDF